MSAPISPALVKRMAGLVLKIMRDSKEESLITMSGNAFAEAAAIARLLPQPDDLAVDGDVLVVRQMLHAHQRAMTAPDSGWGNMSYIAGSYDHLPAFKAALTAYREAKSA